MKSRHPEDYTVIEALNASLIKKPHACTHKTNTSTHFKKEVEERRSSPMDEISEDEAEWLDSELVDCQNKVNNNTTFPHDNDSATDDRRDKSLTPQQYEESPPKNIKIINSTSLKLNETDKINSTESNMLFGKFIASELGRFKGKDRYLVMQKIMGILMQD